MKSVAQSDLAMKSEDSDSTFGFWLYIMTDILLFAALFATYMILRNNIANGPSGQELFSVNIVIAETVLLLTSSVSVGVAALALKFHKQSLAVLLTIATLVLGVLFLGLELYEFSAMVQEGASWQTSAFLSAFFTLVGTHGLHISVGIIWGITLLVVILKRGINHHLIRKFVLFALFWHFLDLIWIFIFTIVYLGGITG